MIDAETRRFIEQSLKDYDSKNKAEKEALAARIKTLEDELSSP